MKCLFIKGLSLGLFSLALTVHASDRVYKSKMGDASWFVNPKHPLVCKLAQHIPYYGRGIFIQEAGKKPEFRMVSLTGSDTEGEGELYSYPPNWSVIKQDKLLGSVLLHEGTDVFRLQNRAAKILLAELSQGWNPTFVHADFNYGNYYVKAQLSAVNFKKAYSEYLVCLQQLLPYGFDDIRDDTIYYPSGRVALSDPDKKMLKRIIRYHEVDPSLSLIQLRGYSDNVGTRRDNYLLTIKRLRKIEEYLISKGIPQEKIDSTAFGERNPVANNGTAEGRAKNRRVTIELTKD